MLQLYFTTSYIDTPKIITVSYEMCPTNIKNYIKSKVSAQVLNLYGTTEFGYVFLEDENSNLVLCPEDIEVDFEKVDQTEDIYELIISSLKNEYMPLINYKVGDLFKLTNEQYSNFNKEHKISAFAGRKKDLLSTGDKKIAILQIDEIISNYEDIMLYQLQKINDKKYVLKILKDDEKIVEEVDLVYQLEKLLDAECRIEAVKNLMPEVSGKFALIKQI